MSTNMLLFAAIIAISVPLVFSGFETYDLLRSEDDLLSEISRFVSLSLVFFDAGGGGADIEIRMSDGLFQRLDFVEFGGPLSSPLCFSIRYRFSGEETRYFLLDDFNLRLTAGDAPLRLPSGVWTIHIEIRAEESGDYVHLSLE